MIIKIALVDDQLLFRQGIAGLILNEPEFNLLMEADNGIMFLEQLGTATVLPDIAIIDMEMPGMDGIRLNDLLHQQYPTIKVIILSVHARERMVARMIEAGASGYLFKNCDKAELVMAVKTVHTSGFYINSQVLKAIQKAATQKSMPLKNVNAIPVDISPREKEILQLLCAEKSNAEIADLLYLSVRTVEGHRKNLLAKTGCRNTAGLVLFAVRYHLFDVLF
jgi:DNA-binding NarL/FixJ family response regulator